MTHKQDAATVMVCLTCSHQFTLGEYGAHGGCPACGRPAIRAVADKTKDYNETFDHTAQEEYKQTEGGKVPHAAVVAEHDRPKRKRERRAGNQDAAMETALIEGTLPEIDRREDGEGDE